jgi:hypothetical protein
MSQDGASQDRYPVESEFPLLERVTAGVLMTVLLALGWMVLSAYAPDGLHFVPVEVEVLIVVALLAAALILVSVVALLHTRSRG